VVRRSIADMGGRGAVIGLLVIREGGVSATREVSSDN